MKSLRKSLDILERVVLAEGAPVTPGAVASALEINAVTAARIMGELAARGYLERVSRRDGYRTGPMVTSLAARDSVYRRLAAAAEAPLLELARHLQMPVNLCVLNAERRMMLTFAGGVPNWKPWQNFFFSRDHLVTATGRLLLAALDEHRAAALLTELGLSGNLTRRERADLRRDGFADFTQDGIRLIGRLLRIDGYPPAAFGFGLRPEADHDVEFHLAEQTARRIVLALNPEEHAY